MAILGISPRFLIGVSVTYNSVVVGISKVSIITEGKIPNNTVGNNKAINKLNYFLEISGIGDK